MSRGRSPWLVAASLAAAAGSTAVGSYLCLVTGRLTLDLGIGRRTQPLGPLTYDIAAAPETVFAMAAAPYAERRPRALRDKVEILERSEGMVLAAHRTPLRRGLTAVTVETVTFQPPHRIGFRLLRGPVPSVVESFEFEPTGSGTRLTYTGELGTDLGRLGETWGEVVARSWVATVRSSLDQIKAESERRTS
ncbi:MAG: SRPBCC family protein [Nocardioides sp.]